MDRVLLCALAPSGAPASGCESPLGCAWRPATDAPEVAALLRSAGTRVEAGVALGDWRLYVLFVLVFVAVLVLIVLFCFYFKPWSCAHSCVRGHPLDEIDEGDFDIPWDTNLIDRPEPYGACVTPPQSISGGSARGVSKKKEAKLPFAPEDLGRRIVRRSSSNSLRGIISSVFTSETLGERTRRGSTSDTIFAIEDLD